MKNIYQDIWRSITIFAVLFFAVLIGWAGIDIFVFNHYESKFGGPWDNLIFSISLALAMTAACVTGYLISLFTMSNYYQSVSARMKLMIGVISSIVTLTLVLSGLVGRFSVLIRGEMFGLVFSFIAAGTISGAIIVFLVANFRSKRSGKIA